MSDKPTCRVAVFVDYQNVYEDLRRAFGPTAMLPTDGQFWPDVLAARLVARGPDFEDWLLDETRVYLGRAAPDRNPKGAAAHDRQTQAWRDRGIVVRPRPLQYLAGQPPRQKGVDVELAVDVVRLAIEDRFDVGIVVSTDTDLLPALEAVDVIRGARRTPRTCAVSYSGLPKQLQFPDLRGRQPYVFRVTAADYAAIHDPMVYVPRAPSVVPDGTSEMSGG